jgi:hypothetical protein
MAMLLESREATRETARRRQSPWAEFASAVVLGTISSPLAAAVLICTAVLVRRMPIKLPEGSMLENSGKDVASLPVGVWGHWDRNLADRMSSKGDFFDPPSGAQCPSDSGQYETPTATNRSHKFSSGAPQNGCRHHPADFYDHSRHLPTH